MDQQGVFTGFNISYPTYTVVTPQTNRKLEVRCLNVSEVNKLKTSITTAVKIPEIINRVVFDSIKDKPEDLATLKQFKKAITSKDREALLYGIYQATFADTVEKLSVSCKECKASDTHSLVLSNIFNIEPFPSELVETYELSKAVATEDIGEDAELETISRIKKVEEKNKVSKKDSKLNILNRREEIVLPKSNITVVLRSPTLEMEEESITGKFALSKDLLELISEIIVIDSFKIYGENRELVNSVSNRTDILYGYQQLPLSDRQYLLDKYKELFSRYGISLVENWTCKECGEDNETEVDIFTHFFRMAIR